MSIMVREWFFRVNMVIGTFPCFHASLRITVLITGFYIEFTLTHPSTGHAGFDIRKGRYPAPLNTWRRKTGLQVERRVCYGLELIGKTLEILIYGRQARLEQGKGFNACCIAFF